MEMLVILGLVRNCSSDIRLETREQRGIVLSFRLFVVPILHIPAGTEIWERRLTLIACGDGACSHRKYYSGRVVVYVHERQPDEMPGTSTLSIAIECSWQINA